MKTAEKIPVQVRLPDPARKVGTWHVQLLIIASIIVLMYGNFRRRHKKIISYLLSYCILVTRLFSIFLMVTPNKGIYFREYGSVYVDIVLIYL